MKPQLNEWKERQQNNNLSNDSAIDFGVVQTTCSPKLEIEMRIEKVARERDNLITSTPLHQTTLTPLRHNLNPNNPIVSLHPS